jgi:hypothetical protein
VPDLAIVDEVAGQAPAGAEEGIRGAAEVKAAGFRLVHEPASLLEIDREGLFREDVLASAQCRERHAEMGSRDSEVDHEVDILAGEKLIDGQGLDAVSARLRLRHLRLHVRAGAKGEAAICGDVLEIDARDVAASDDADVEGVHDP